MRFLALAALVLGGSLGASAAPWSLELKWGDSIPAGTVYSIRLESTGELQAERTGLPFTDQGLTVVRHSQKLSADAAAAILAAAERAVRGSDPEKTQGRMVGDGGFASLQIWVGTASRGAGLSHLSSLDEAGSAWRALFSRLEETLPDGFIK